MQVILLGDGEHARVVAGAAEVIARLEAADEAGIPQLRRLHPEAGFLLAIGDLDLRRRLAAKHAGLPWATVIHPRAWVAPEARLLGGVFVGAMAVIQPGAAIGMHAIINTSAVVEHDCRLDEGVHLAPGAILGGGVSVGAWSLIGLGARVRDHRHVGADATVGMGAAVAEDVADGTTVMGVPARIRGPR